jgi:hypothetical protein
MNEQKLKKKNITWVCNKEDIDNKRFDIKELRIFTLNTGTKIYIKDYARIVDGDITYVQ